MKTTVYLTLILVIACTSKIFGQLDMPISPKDYKSAKTVKESSFVVVLNDKETTTDSVIRASMKKYWTFCEYDFIKASEYNKYLVMNGYAMLAPLYISRQGGLTSSDYEYQVMICTKQAKYANIGYVEHFHLPCIYENKKVQLLNYSYIIPYMICSMNKSLEDKYATGGKTTKKNKSKEDKGNSKITYEPGGYAKVHNIDFLVCKDGVKDEASSKKAIADMLKITTDKIKFVSGSEITNAISKQKEIGVICGSITMDFEVFLASDLSMLAHGEMLSID